MSPGRTKKKWRRGWDSNPSAILEIRKLLILGKTTKTRVPTIPRVGYSLGTHFLTILALLLLFSAMPGFAQVRYDTFFLKPLPAGGVGAVSGLATVCPGSGLATTAASVSGNIATLTMASNPITAGFVSGRSALIIGFTGTDTYFNGTFILTGVTSTQLTYALTHANNSASTNGGAIQTPTASSGCSPTTSVYSDQALTSVITQPFADDGKGNIGFFATPGNYYVAYSASGLNPMPLNYVTLPLVPGAGGALVSPTITNPTITGTDSGAETLQNKTFDISVNTLKNSTNTAGHVPRNNGTQYVDGQLAATDLSTPLQGTDANLLTSGTVSASTGVSLCTDANHGATTTGCASGGVTEAIVNTGPANIVGNAGACTAGSGGTSCAFFILANAHTLTRFSFNLGVTATTCSTQAVIGVRDVTSSSNLTTSTISNSQALGLVDSGAISVAMTAGHTFFVGLITASSGCAGNPQFGSLSMVYQ